MSDALTKLTEAAALVGLTVIKTPGNRYRFEDAQGSTISVVGNLDEAVELIRLHSKAQAKQAKAETTKTEKPARAKAPKAGEQIPAEMVAQYQELPNGIDRARILREAQDTYGRTAVMQQLDISTTNLSRQLASLHLVEASETIRQLFEGGRLSWAKIHGQVATKMRHGLQEQERIAQALAAA